MAGPVLLVNVAEAILIAVAPSHSDRDRRVNRRDDRACSRHGLGPHICDPR